jgi:hypothetical protein
MTEFEKQDADVSFSTNFDRSFKLATDKFPHESIPRRIQAKWKGKWWPAKLLEQNDNQVKVHWMSIGWDSDTSDSWLALDKIRFLDDGSETHPQHQIGDKVQVLWKGKYYNAQIEQTRGGEYFVHYDGFDQKWDEWVPDERLR